MADPKPLISIIVPFYNIEDCVRRCMESLLSQTFRDYEIVCVDDGSTDGTSDLLDDYGAYANVVVCHKENGGLSDARNHGVKIANGKLVSFVDGDDVVSPYYLESLENCYRECRGGIVIGQIRYLDPSFKGLEKENWEKPTAGKRVSKTDILAAYMYEDVLPSACCRLASRELYINHPFPTGKVYEEIHSAADYIADADSVYLIDGRIYGYVMREGSIVHKSKATLKQVRDYIVALDHFAQVASAHFQPDSPEMCYFYALHYSRIFRLMNTSANVNRAETGRISQSLVDAIRLTLVKTTRDKNVRPLNKTRLLLLGFAPFAYCRCFNLYDRLTRV